MRRLLLAALLLTGSAAAAPYRVGDFATALGPLINTTPKFAGGTLTWTARVIAPNDAVARVEVFAVPIQGKTFTRAVGVGGDFLAAQAPVVPQVILTAAAIGGRCFGLSAREQAELRQWVAAQIGEGAGLAGGVTYERSFGRMTQRVRLGTGYGGSVRVVLTGLRRDTPGTAGWPTYCVVR